MLEHYLNSTYPMDLIKLIESFICDCDYYKCNFCDNLFTCCYLKICASCKKRTCCDKECPKFPVDFIMTYSGKDTKIMCCHKCGNC
jgi:hypothetical protein